MISAEHYEILKPFIEGIKRFKETGSHNGDVMHVLNTIRQSMGMGHIDFNCDGCKYNALTDAYNWILEYEDKMAH